MQYFPPTAIFVCLVSFFINGHLIVNNVQIQVYRIMEELLDLKEDFADLQKVMANVRRDFNQNFLEIQTFIGNGNTTICHCSGGAGSGQQYELSTPIANGKYGPSLSNDEVLIKLDMILKGLAKEKANRINFVKANEAMENIFRQNLSYLATTIENVRKNFDIKFNETNAIASTCGIKLNDKVNTIERKINEIMSNFHETWEDFDERVEKWHRDQEVNGNWTAWGSWTRCSSSCGPGVRSRVRTCTNPAPSNGGNDCAGDALECIECQSRSCEVWLNCPGRWVEYQGSCYLFEDQIQNRRSWKEAEEFCGRIKSYLLRIDNQMEFEFIQGVLLELHDKQLKQGVTPLSGYWTGGNDILEEGNWVWSPKYEKMRFTVWQLGEPNNDHGKEHCVELNRHMWFKMNDYNCSQKVYYICEKLLFTFSHD